MVKTALEPSWEARFEACSYGFRPGRSIHDAMEHVFLFLRKKRSNYRHEWVLDADIRGAFDHINHDFIMERIGAFPAREEIKAWLKAGYLEYGRLNDTEEGTPQGGVISPLLANIALDGLREVLNQYRIPGSKSGRLGYVRYADDFIVLAPTRETLGQVRLTISEWLAVRGLQLSEEKTRIIPIDDGFNFLGFNVRRYNGKLLIKPQKEKVLAKLHEIKQWLNRHKQVRQDQVIKYLNPILRGWANNYRHQCSKDTYRYVGWRIFRMLWTWALRRHSTKGKRWVKNRYFPRIGGRNWQFATETEVRRGKRITAVLYDVTSTPIIRHPIVRTGASKDDPSLRDYWAARNRYYGRVRYVVDMGKMRLAYQQNWKCPECKTGLFNGESVDVYHPTQRADGDNGGRFKVLIRHEACHFNAYGRDNRKITQAFLMGAV
ncbi:MAG: reverse transcriptase domain-containing protein [Chloroflexi bacterium]|nr:reverse transcriptase domain-containing protein [Chloroflexota bacterium]